MSDPTYSIFIALLFLQQLVLDALVLKPPSLKEQKTIVQQQLGYLPPNFRCVSAWTQGDKISSPVAIQSYPLNGGAPKTQAKSTTPALALGTPFPTLYWLSNPDISRAVADLERRGYVTILKEKLNNSPQDSSLLIESHEQYAKKRWNSLSQEDQTLLMMDHPSVRRMRNMIECSGVAGADFLSQKQPDGSILASFKCLHAHYAHYRSSKDDPDKENIYNPVGLWVHELLQEQFPDLNL